MSMAAEATRVRLGASTATAPSVLRELAGDPSVTVRATLALNPLAPPEVNALLARDTDERVRVLLARKLGALAPGLSEPARARMHEQVLETLSTLVADEAVRVRAAVAEEVKQWPGIPREIALRLAYDPDVMVCEPVIRFSPLLGPAELIALVAHAPAAGTVHAVARRDGIGAEISDAIVGSADAEAIQALLCNHSAQIREATLDTLIDQAEDHLDWHEPLVRRPALPPRAARALSQIVARHLVEVLAERADLEPALAGELRARLAARLDCAAAQGAAAAETGINTAVARAERLAAEGKLTEDALLATVRGGDVRLATAMLSVKAGVPLATVEHAASLRSAKGLVSLAWKAGFSMNAATAVQSLLARLAPDSILAPGIGGSFPLAIEEMRWQIDFLSGLGG